VPGLEVVLFCPPLPSASFFSTLDLVRCISSVDCVSPTSLNAASAVAKWSRASWISAKQRNSQDQAHGSRIHGVFDLAHTGPCTYRQMPEFECAEALKCHVPRPLHCFLLELGVQFPLRRVLSIQKG